MMSRRALPSFATAAALVGSGTISLLVLSAFFPDDLNMPHSLSCITCFASFTAFGHLTLQEWEQRENQNALQTNARRFTMCAETTLIFAIASLHALRPSRMRPWMAIRLIFAVLGIFDLVHTTWLHWLCFTWPEVYAKPVSYMGGQRQPSYWLSVWLNTMAVAFTVNVRQYVALRTGGARLALRLGQLTHSELRTMVPDGKRGHGAPIMWRLPRSDKSRMSGSSEGERMQWVADPAVQDDDADSLGSRDKEARSEEASQPKSEASHVTNGTWSSWGRRWEAEWQEQREREIEIERQQRLAEDVHEYVGDGGAHELGHHDCE